MSRITRALEHLKNGGMILLTDDESRENEGDIVVAAEFATPQAVNFMITHARGLMCVPMTGEQIDLLGLAPMVARNLASRKTAFTVSIEARTGITTGISAFDRARTIEAATAPDAKLGDVVSPGHVFPLRAEDGGVLARDGHTEGAVDLMRLAGLRPAAVICEVVGENGEMSHGAELENFATRHGLPMLSIAEIAAYRMQHDILVDDVAQTRLPSLYTDEAMRTHAFRSRIDGQEHLALVNAPPGGSLAAPADGSGEAPLVRVHSECLTGDALGSMRCDCGEQLRHSMRMISEASSGALLYMRGQEGRGIGLANKIRAYALQDHGRDTVEANHDLGFADDLRDYGMAAQILKALGITRLRLLSNNPRKAEALERYGLQVVETVPLEIAANPHNARYLATKREKLGHALHVQGTEAA
ncbi:GTP cyclohydrolase II /3,4-dihydroxy-2-butanone 4-phosphate synthase [Faunimonas pinastri]|uniref:Multifunctional fusion protein n=1 Tax=Faunimonas pinastri TaxID=1855383 RepID=A0A1H9H283_9HYPH|nr:3,4-dihydroxy-2-butanone-4-phosphate synthase [Faunimonas pinastri]SEQ56442.1 GTP cyclohydrolase II /3,4-dihydroxy-2-butanone 4-phosphate synthase [Faunimonas pinastri]